MEIRLFDKEKDYETLCEWWDDWGKPPHPKEALSESSSIGKIFLNTLSRPFCKFLSKEPGVDKNCLYDFFWTSIKLGIDNISFNLPKFFLTFFFQ